MEPARRGRRGGAGMKSFRPKDGSGEPGALAPKVSLRPPAPVLLPRSAGLWAALAWAIGRSTLNDHGKYNL
jgi:hypothetical protein